MANSEQLWKDECDIVPVRDQDRFNGAGNSFLDYQTDNDRNASLDSHHENGNRSWLDTSTEKIHPDTYGSDDRFDEGHENYDWGPLQDNVKNDPMMKNDRTNEWTFNYDGGDSDRNDFEKVGRKKDEPRELCLFSQEYFRRKWMKFRDMVDYCYPALSGQKNYYKRCSLPPSDNGGEITKPNGNRERAEDELVEEEYEDYHVKEPDEGSTPNLGDSLDQSAGDNYKEPKTEVEMFQPIHPTERELFGRYEEGREALSETPIDTKPDDKSPMLDSYGDSHVWEETVVCCTDNDFWTTLWILIMAPFVGFTVYLFTQWFKTRQEYNEKLGHLNRINRDIENLKGDINRLDAFVWSCQMSPIVGAKRQAKLEAEIKRIFQSLKNHKQKIKELEEDHAVHREVLWNLKTCA